MQQKKLSKRQKISFTLSLIWYLFSSFFAMILFALFYNDVVLIISSILLLAIFLIWAFGALLDYKIEYFFLGKEYKKQWKLINHLRTLNPKYYSYLTVKNAKRTFRKTGNILNSVKVNTPFSPLMLLSNDTPSMEDCKSHNTIWKNFLITSLNFYIIESDGLWGFFDNISSEYDIDFDSLCEDFKSISDFPKELVTILTSADSRMLFEYPKIFNILSKEEIHELDKTIELHTNKANKFKPELYKLLQDLAYDHYKDIYSLYELPQKTSSVYLNKSKDERYIIYFDERKKVYKILFQKFEMILDSQDKLFNIHTWIKKESFGLYGTKELATHEIVSKIKDNDNFHLVLDKNQEISTHIV